MEDARSALLASAAGWIMEGLEAAGLAAIVIGAVLTTTAFIRARLGGEGEAAYVRYRAGLGRAILIGLELLVAADIVGTVVAPLELDKIAALGLVVLIRTLLSLSIEVEISGRWPWQGRERRQEDR
jgi:uncharacterized membrane protein